MKTDAIHGPLQSTLDISTNPPEALQNGNTPQTDLHTHTTASDGSLTPKELIRLGKKIGLSSLAVTDHDTVSGLPEAMEEGKKLGLSVIPGVEISTFHNGCDIHLLGLFIRPDTPELSSALSYMAEKRKERNRAMIQKLHDAGFPICQEDFPQESGMVTRTHIGALLAERGRASTPMEAVREYMVPGGIGYVPKARFSPEECAKLIRKAGGAVIITHINQIAKDPSKALSTARELLVENIADGLETLYCQYDDFWRKETRRLAEETGSLSSGGSDFHGQFKPGLSLGKGYGDLFVPQTFADSIEHFVKERRN